jgi:V8-like Glu-specific endopeptidase
MRSRVLAIVAAALLLAIVLPGAAAAKPATSADLYRAQVIAYWTPARIAAATPRDYVRDSSGHLVPKAKPGSGGTGASWTGDGIIEQRSGRVLFTQGGSDWICSGSVITDAGTNSGYSTVLTAGHCVYDGADGWATKWMFIPDFDDAPTYTCANTFYGCWVATRLGANHTFVAGGGFGTNTTVAVDYGFARVGLGGKGAIGTIELDQLVGSYGLQTSGATNADTQWAFGYPAAGRYHGKDLIYCKGANLIDDPNGANTWGMPCNMTGGSSGGPWMFGTSDPGTDANKTVSSLNSYGYSGLAYMFGPKFNSATATVRADTAAGNDTATTDIVNLAP